MSLDIGYVPNVVKSLYAEENSAFYYVNPFDESLQENRKFENSSIYMSDTSLLKYGCAEIPERQSHLSSDVAFHPPDNICASFLSKSNHDYQFDLNEQVTDFSADRFCQFQKREISSEYNNSHASNRYHVSTFCDDQSPRSSLGANRPSKDAVHNCQQCGRSFKRNSYLKKHLENHSNATNLNCEICKIQFRLKSELRRHMLVHSSEKPHICHSCGKLFKSRRLLKCHHKVHDRKRNFRCEICTKQFSSEKQLEEHVADHSEVKLHLIQPWQRSLERSLHCSDELRKENGTLEFFGLAHLSPSLSAIGTGTEATSLGAYEISPQIRSPNYPKLDGLGTFDAESPIHVDSTSSVSLHLLKPMAPTSSDAHLTTSDFRETWPVNENVYTFVSSPSYWENLNRTTDNPSVMHSDHIFTSF